MKTYRALMLEGRPSDRGKVMEARSHRITLAVPVFSDQMFDPDWNLSTPDFYMQRIDFEWMRISFFEAIIPIWVPGWLSYDEPKRNAWIIHRLVAPELLRGIAQVGEIPDEWTKPANGTTHVKSTRQGEITTGQKGLTP